MNGRRHGFLSAKLGHEIAPGGFNTTTHKIMPSFAHSGVAILTVKIKPARVKYAEMAGPIKAQWRVSQRYDS
jgi:hypothetical protein